MDKVRIQTVYMIGTMAETSIFLKQGSAIEYFKIRGHLYRRDH